MLWTLLCVDHPNTTEARDRLRTVHRQYLDAKGSGIFFSGPLLSDDAAEQIGSLFVLNAKTRDEVQAFIDSEPFNNAGVFASTTIFRMRKVRFNPHLVDVE